MESSPPPPVPSGALVEPDLPAGTDSHGESTFEVSGRFKGFDPTRRDIAPGEVLFRAGEPGDAVHLLVKGKVEVLAPDVAGVEHRISVVRAGRTLGGGPLLRGGAHTTTARALGKAAVLTLTRDQYEGVSALADSGNSTELEYLLLRISADLADHADEGTETAAGAMQREMEHLRARDALSSFLVYLQLGFCAYAVAMRAVTGGAVSAEHSTWISGPLLLFMAGMAVLYYRASGLPREAFGLSWAGAGRKTLEAVLWTLPFLGLLTGLRALALRWVPDLDGAPLLPGFQGPLNPVELAAYGVYTLMVPAQEFLRSGAVQGSLASFLSGSPARRTLWSIVLSNALFATTHLHLTLTYGLVAFVFGIGWGLLYARQKTLVGPIVSHALIGLWALYVLGFGRLLETIG